MANGVWEQFSHLADRKLLHFFFPSNKTFDFWPSKAVLAAVAAASFFSLSSHSFSSFGFSHTQQVHCVGNRLRPHLVRINVKRDHIYQIKKKKKKTFFCTLLFVHSRVQFTLHSTRATLYYFFPLLFLLISISCILYEKNVGPFFVVRPKIN